MESIAAQLDHWRGGILRVILASRRLRGLFLSRVFRLAFLFSISIVFSFVLSLFFPLWVLALGPVFFGVPHIFAGLRYFPHYRKAGKFFSADRKLLCASAGLTALVAGYRIFLNGTSFAPTFSEWQNANGIELGALIGVYCFGFFAVYRKVLHVQRKGSDLKRFALGACMLSPLLFGMWYDPLSTVGSLVLIHNFVAFIFWIRTSESTSEKILAWSAFTITVGITVLIFLGCFDHLFGSETLGFAGLNANNLGKTKKTMG